MYGSDVCVLSKFINFGWNPNGVSVLGSRSFSLVGIKGVPENSYRFMSSLKSDQIAPTLLLTYIDGSERRDPKHFFLPFFFWFLSARGKCFEGIVRTRACILIQLEKKLCLGLLFRGKTYWSSPHLKTKPTSDIRRSSLNSQFMRVNIIYECTLLQQVCNICSIFCVKFVFLFNILGSEKLESLRKWIGSRYGMELIRSGLFILWLFSSNICGIRKLKCEIVWEDMGSEKYYSIENIFDTIKNRYLNIGKLKFDTMWTNSSEL